MAAFRQGYPKDILSVTFDSNYRTSGTVSMPIFTFNESIKRVGKIIVNKILLSGNSYIFNTGNNSLGTINSTTITITAGTYTAATLAAAIQVSIRASGGGFTAATCTYSTSTYKFTITSGSVSTFTLDSSSTLAPILGFSANQTSVATATSDFAVYETRFIITVDNRTFIITQSAVDYTFTITAGNYSGTTLANEIQTQITLQLANFTVTYLANNHTIKFTCNASFTVKSTGSASALLGFTSNTDSTSNIVLAPYPLNIIGPTSIIVKSRAITNLRTTVANINSLSPDFICEFIWDNALGEFTFEQLENGSKIRSLVGGGSTLSSIDFRLCDDTGKILSLGVNGRWKIFVSLEIY